MLTNGHSFFVAQSKSQPPPKPRHLPAPFTASLSDPSGYIADDGLVDAVHIALWLRRPLLLTGEPGTGKTRLAYSLANQLGYAEPLRFDTKSTSKAKDLFYTYDALARLQMGQDGKRMGPEAFLTMNALGLAIALANDPSSVAAVIPPELDHRAPRPSVVLIDEIDKAPRDFPNDILGELEELYCRIPELGGYTLRAPPDLAPVVVLTSNSERNLPDAFLRRCVFYDIPFPGPERLADIVESRLHARLRDTPLLKDVLRIFGALRAANPSLHKPPGTAELLDWVVALHHAGVSAMHNLRQVPLPAQRTLPALLKTKADREVGTRIVLGLLR